MTNHHRDITTKQQSLAWQAVRAFPVGLIGMRDNRTYGETRGPCDG